MIHQAGLPSTSTLDKTPYEALFGTKPSIDHLRVFGCLAWVHVLKDDRKSFQPKASRCVFLGYQTGSKSYRFWHRSNDNASLPPPLPAFPTLPHIAESSINPPSPNAENMSFDFNPLPERPSSSPEPQSPVTPAPVLPEIQAPEDNGPRRSKRNHAESQPAAPKPKEKTKTKPKSSKTNNDMAEGPLIVRPRREGDKVAFVGQRVSLQVKLRPSPVSLPFKNH